MAERILIVDDDARLAQMLSEYLTQRGLEVEWRPNASSGMTAALDPQFAAVILDVMLPDGDGFDLCRQIRAQSSVPVLMLTARGDDEDRIVGLELGADDYLPKPFNPRELLARLRAVLRRRAPLREPDSKAPSGSAILRFGPLELDPEARQARVNGRATDLTSHQFALLLVLAKRRGRVQSRDQLMSVVRGTELEAFDRSIDVHISRIRAAIEPDPRKPRYIKTVRSEGYVFLAPAETEPAQ